MMEDLGIKKNGYLETNPLNSNGRDSSGSLDGLRKSFQELVSKAETNFGNNISSLTEGTNIGAILANTTISGYRSEPREYMRDHDQPASSSRSDDQGHNARNTNTHQSDPAKPRNDQHDAEHQSRSESPDAARNSHDDNNASNTDSKSEAAPRDKAETNSSSSDDKAETAENGVNSQDQSQDSNSSNQNASSSQSGDQSADTAVNPALQAMAQTANGSLNIAGAMLANKKIGAQSQINDPGQAKTQESQAGNATTSGQQSTGPRQSNVQSHTLGQSNAAAQSTAQMADGGQKEATVAQQQASELTKVIGNTTKTQVNVVVKNDADTLTSKPSSILAAGTALASEATKSSSQAGKQGSSHQVTPGQNNAQAIAAAQNQVNMQQSQAQQNAQQNAQLQAANQGASINKGVLAGAQGAQTSAAAGSTGGESTLTQTAATTAANSSQQSNQSQQTQSAQANQNVKTSTPGQPIVDQISVKISKALQTGSDRISVQLRPSELGRVDVKMEVGNDGRVLAVVTADNKDTLDLLKRDSSDLQRALEDAGMQLDSGDLSFNLRGEEQEMAEQENVPGGQNINGDDDILDDDIPDMAMVADLETDIMNGRIDVKA